MIPRKPFEDDSELDIGIVHFVLYVACAVALVIGTWLTAVTYLVAFTPAPK